MQRVGHDRLDHLIADLRLAPPPRRDRPNRGDTAEFELGPPPPHRVRRRVQLPSNRFVCHPIGREQQPTSLMHPTMRQRRRPRHPLQRSPIGVGNLQRSGNHHRHTATIAPPRYFNDAPLGRGIRNLPKILIRGQVAESEGSASRRSAPSRRDPPPPRHRSPFRWRPD